MGEDKEDHSQILYLYLYLYLLHPCRAGNGDWGLGSVNQVMFFPFLPPQWEDFSHYSSAPTWDPSFWRHSSMGFSSVSPFHGLHIFTNYVSPSHGVLSFRNRLSSVGPLQGHRFCQQNLLQTSYMDHSLFLASTCSGTGSSMGCGGQPASPGAAGCRGISAPKPGALLTWMN